MKKIFIIALFSVGYRVSAQTQMDKISHLAVGGCIAGLTYSVSHNLTEKKWVPFAAGMTFSITAAVLKEVRDKKLYNSPMNESMKDIAFTTLGAGLACFTLRFSF